MSSFITVLKRAVATIGATALGLVVLLAAGGAILAGPTMWSQLSGRVRIETLRQGTLERHVRTYLPARRERRPALVLNLQGAGGNGAFQEAITGFDAQADRLGWIVAYPDAATGGWHTFGCCQSNSLVDDVGFMAMLIDRLESTDAIDPARVYVTGASRGGMMAYRLACELSSRVAAVAPVAGNMADPGGSAAAVPCAPSRPVSVLDIHGSADPEVPIDGGRSRVNVEDVSYAPLRDVIAIWRGIDQCAAAPSATAVGGYQLTAWSCRGGSSVQSLVVAGAGHTYPGALFANPPMSAAAGIDASRLIADFFAAQCRAGVYR
jgi:polyhydroxybutyrate depolymerase